MVDGVLTYSTLKAEKLIKERIDLTEVITNIEADLELLFQRYRVNLRHSNLPVIDGGPFLIYQLFYNLINNSLKFSRTGVESLIEVSSEQLSPSDARKFNLDDNVRFVKITVSDNGIGFSQEYAKSIFQSFTRLHPKDQFEGTGLGLALCKMIVEKHNGYIEAFGKENEGARFNIILPESSR
jgi:signal transduction histidine kinase